VKKLREAGGLTAKKRLDPSDVDAEDVKKSLNPFLHRCTNLKWFLRMNLLGSLHQIIPPFQEQAAASLAAAECALQVGAICHATANNSLHQRDLPTNYPIGLFLARPSACPSQTPAST